MPTLDDRLEKAKQQRNRADRQLRALRKKISEKNRRAEAHRKIQLGGVVIAARADELDPAEIAGVLDYWLDARAKKPEQAEAMRQRGLMVFEKNHSRKG